MPVANLILFIVLIDRLLVAFSSLISFVKVVCLAYIWLHHFCFHFSHNHSIGISTILCSSIIARHSILLQLACGFFYFSETIIKHQVIEKITNHFFSSVVIDVQVLIF
jgi:hypothetical protein